MRNKTRHSNEETAAHTQQNWYDVLRFIPNINSNTLEILRNELNGILFFICYLYVDSIHLQFVPKRPLVSNSAMVNAPGRY